VQRDGAFRRDSGVPGAPELTLNINYWLAERELIGHKARRYSINLDLVGA